MQLGDGEPRRQRDEKEQELTRGMYAVRAGSREEKHGDDERERQPGHIGGKQRAANDPTPAADACRRALLFGSALVPGARCVGGGKAVARC